MLLNGISNNGYEGLVLGNRYRIARRLGRGGMADVYLATDLLENKEVAVKILKAEFSADAEFLRRFEREARAVSSLSHPNIVQVYDIGEENGIHYMVMEYIEGITLKELLHQCVRLDWDAAIPIVIQIGLALEHAHRNGIIHRDIKPQNIMITPDVKAKVTDFGIASASSANTITMTGRDALGSVHYFSPEQARGGLVGEKSDIYSLGILLYELVTGVLPFDGDTSVSIAIKHLQENPQLPSSLQPLIPAGLDGIILKCIQKSPDKRYASASDLVADLDALMIDPDGEYGMLDHFAEVSSTIKVGPIRQEPNYGKVGQIESIMNERRRLRRRDLVIILTLVFVAGIALVNIGKIAWKSFVNKIPTQSSTDFIVGNYIGMQIKVVEEQLCAAGFSTDAYKIEYVPEDTVQKGFVVRQAPSVGSVIKPGGMTILNLYMSGGQTLVTLGDYAGQNYLKAKTQLEATLGFTVTVHQENSDKYLKDQVIRTDPAAGQNVPKGGEVIMFVSIGKERVKVPALLGAPRNLARKLLTDLLLVEGGVQLTAEAKLIPESEQIVIFCDPVVGTEVEIHTPISIRYGTTAQWIAIINPTPIPDPHATTAPTTVLTTATTPTTIATTVPTIPTTAAPPTPTTT